MSKPDYGDTEVWTDGTTHIRRLRPTSKTPPEYTVHVVDTPDGPSPVVSFHGPEGSGANYQVKLADIPVFMLELHSIVDKLRGDVA